MGWRGGWGKLLMSFKTRSRFSYCGTPLHTGDINTFRSAHEEGEGGGVGWRGGWGKPLLSYKTRSRFSYCGTPLSVRAISIHSEAYMRGGGRGVGWDGERDGVSRSCLIKQGPSLAIVALLSLYGRYQYIQKRT